MYLRRPSPSELKRLLARATLDSLTYDEVGATERDTLPHGYRHMEAERRIGDPEVFARAVTGLRTWATHEGSGISILPTGQSVTPGSTFLSVASIGPLKIVAPCRITRITDGPDSFGFTYGTLPGHPVRGEEAFLVERRANGTFFRITAFSTPSQLRTRTDSLHHDCPTVGQFITGVVRSEK
jgi:uncharacterized protein (UPF0548 family)